MAHLMINSQIFNDKIVIFEIEMFECIESTISATNFGHSLIDLKIAFLNNY